MSEEHDDNDRYHILALASLTARVLKDGETFAVFDRRGDLRSATTSQPGGLYHRGTRFLSTFRLRVQGAPLLPLGASVRDNLMLTVDLMNPDLQANDGSTIAHGALHGMREGFLFEGTYYEHVRISNFECAPVDIRLEFEIAADFVDVFEVRGTARARRGEQRPPEIHADGLVLSYHGLDRVLRSTRLRFAPAPSHILSGSARFQLQLEAKQTRDLYVSVGCELGEAEQVAQRADYGHARERARAQWRADDEDWCAVVSSNEQFNQWIERAMYDLRMLVTRTPQGPYPYAGVPWFATPFGRDGIITALQAMWAMPRLGRGVLEFLAARQASELDPQADAEPGKILHECRFGEMAELREIPFGRYFGSVDSTPLFVMLAQAHDVLCGDTEFTDRMWPHIERVLQWLERYGDADGDGFVEYESKCESGLAQQGWKDSHDSVFHADGALAHGPIALCEVQGYAFRAWLGSSQLAGRSDRPAQARTLREKARALRERFDTAFWCDDIQTFALALDGDKRPCRVRASNAGHSLFTGIALPRRAAALSEQLLSPAMFSGWGIRTLASTEQRYNPMSYHNGSVWPHDNAVIAAGLARYGDKRAALRILSALFDASVFLDLRRLPELFCGFGRRPDEGPTLYPVACSPQAWAAAAPMSLLKSVLGLHVDGRAERVYFDRPVLPPFLDQLRLLNLHVGHARIDLLLRRYSDGVGIHVERRSGDIAVVTRQ